jgi:hypothetical protein
MNGPARHGVLDEYVPILILPRHDRREPAGRVEPDVVVLYRPEFLGRFVDRTQATSRTP